MYKVKLLLQGKQQTVFFPMIKHKLTREKNNCRKPVSTTSDLTASQDTYAYVLDRAPRFPEALFLFMFSFCSPDWPIFTDLSSSSLSLSSGSSSLLLNSHSACFHFCYCIFQPQNFHFLKIFNWYSLIIVSIFSLIFKVSFSYLGTCIIVGLSPHWCGSVGWASSCKAKGRQFNSWSGHMSGLQVQSLVGVCVQGRCFSFM